MTNRAKCLRSGTLEYKGFSNNADLYGFGNVPFFECSISSSSGIFVFATAPPVRVAAKCDIRRINETTHGDLGDIRPDDSTRNVPFENINRILVGPCLVITDIENKYLRMIFKGPSTLRDVSV